jgi:hypothetical protein
MTCQYCGQKTKDDTCSDCERVPVSKAASECGMTPQAFAHHMDHGNIETVTEPRQVRMVTRRALRAFQKKRGI